MPFKAKVSLIATPESRELVNVNANGIFLNPKTNLFVAQIVNRMQNESSSKKIDYRDIHAHIVRGVVIISFSNNAFTFFASSFIDAKYKKVVISNLNSKAIHSVFVPYVNGLSDNIHRTVCNSYVKFCDMNLNDVEIIKGKRASKNCFMHNDQKQALLDCFWIVSKTPFPQKSVGKVEIAFESVEEASKLFSVYGKTASRQKALKPKSNIVTQKRNVSSPSNASISAVTSTSTGSLVSVEDLLAADSGSPVLTDSTREKETADLLGLNKNSLKDVPSSTNPPHPKNSGLKNLQLLPLNPIAETQPTAPVSNSASSVQSSILGAPISALQKPKTSTPSPTPSNSAAPLAPGATTTRAKRASSNSSSVAINPLPNPTDKGTKASSKPGSVGNASGPPLQ